MTYTPNVPNAGDIISETQPTILTNFQQLNTLFALDHGAFDDGTPGNRGLHKKITFIEQSADPTTAANETALYTRDVGGSPRLFIRPQSNGTAYRLSGPDPAPGTTGSTWLPGGILLQWGSASSTATTTQNISFPTTFTTIYQVVGNQSDRTRSLAITNVSNSNFTISLQNPIGGLTIRWFAIGAI